MSKTTRQALYEKLRKAQAESIESTCARIEVPTLRAHAYRIGWLMRIPRNQKTQTITFEMIRK